MSALDWLRLLERPEDLGEHTHKGAADGAGGSIRVDPIALLAPFLDAATVFEAAGYGASAEAAQASGFGTAAVLTFCSLLRRRVRGKDGWTVGRYGVLLAVILLAFFFRSGLLGLLIGTCGWRSQVAIGFAVIATALVMRFGVLYCAEGGSLLLGGGNNWQAGVLALILAGWLLRLIYCPQIELLPTETYYWNYSRHLDIGYLDHPPMVALLIRAGTVAFGNTELGVRIGAICCGLVATFFMFRLTQNLFGVPSAWVAAALMQILPFFFLSNMVMNPDAPLTAAWVASLYFLERALIARQARAWWGVGLCLGLGLLSKYTIALLAASACLFLLLDGQSRIWWRRAEPYWAALLALAIFSPVILWNALHEWASFAFQVSRRLAAKSHFSLQVSVASAIVLLTPIGLAAATVLLRRRAPNIPGDEPTDRQRAWRFLQISAGLPLFFLAGFSLFHQIELDWSGPAWTAALPAIAFGIVHKGDPWKKGVIAWLRIVWVPTLLVLLVFDGLRFYYFTAGIPGLGYGEHPENIPVGWRELGRQVNQLAAQSAAAPLIVGMDPYFLAGELAFYAPDPNKAATKTASGHLFGHTGLMYERWFPLEAERGRALLLVAWDPDVLDSPEVRGGVESLAAVQVGDLTRNGRPIRRFYYRFAYGYRGLTPVVSPTER